MPLFVTHALLVITGFITMTIAAIMAMFFRKRRSWLILHRRTGVTGALVIAAGGLIAVVMVAGGGRDHFQASHSWLGVSALIMAVATPLLGALILRWRDLAVRIRPLHRWSGRLALLLVACAIASGLAVAGMME